MLLTSEEIPLYQLHSQWLWVVEQFSTRQLTHSSDVFAALEGVATIFHDKSKLGRYFCGLWETNFLGHLIWRSDRSSVVVQHRKPSRYRAPSWSWAAVEGSVRNAANEVFFRWTSAGSEMTKELGSDGLFSHQVLHIRCIKVEMEGQTSFGPVVEAILQLKGVIHPVRRGKELSRGEYAIRTPEGLLVGTATWDIDEVAEQDMHFWICPVMQRQESENGWAMSDYLSSALQM